MIRSTCVYSIYWQKQSSIFPTRAWSFAIASRLPPVAVKLWKRNEDHFWRTGSSTDKYELVLPQEDPTNRPLIDYSIHASSRFCFIICNIQHTQLTHTGPSTPTCLTVAKKLYCSGDSQGCTLFLRSLYPLIRFNKVAKFILIFVLKAGLPDSFSQ